MNSPVMTIPAISMNSFFNDIRDPDDDTPPLMRLAEAEIILGQDAKTQQVFVVEGKEALSDVVSDVDHDPVNVLVVELDRDSDELRQLRWLIDVAKCRS